MTRKERIEEFITYLGSDKKDSMDDLRIFLEHETEALQSRVNVLEKVLGKIEALLTVEPVMCKDILAITQLIDLAKEGMKNES